MHYPPAVDFNGRLEAPFAGASFFRAPQGSMGG